MKAHILAAFFALFFFAAHVFILQSETLSHDKGVIAERSETLPADVALNFEWQRPEPWSSVKFESQ